MFETRESSVEPLQFVAHLGEHLRLGREHLRVGVHDVPDQHVRSGLLLEVGVQCQRLAVHRVI